MLNVTSKDTFVKPLAEPRALENGVEFLGEVAVYGTMLGLGIYELNKMSRDSKKKEAAQQQTISEIQGRIRTMETQYALIYEDLHKLVAEASETVKSLEATRQSR
jgi:hypothetical protein